MGATQLFTDDLVFWNIPASQCCFLFTEESSWESSDTASQTAKPLSCHTVICSHIPCTSFVLINFMSGNIDEITGKVTQVCPHRWDLNFYHFVTKCVHSGV